MDADIEGVRAVLLELVDAGKALEVASAETRRAEACERDCRERLNRAQQGVDGIVDALRAAAPRYSDWNTPRAVSL